MITNYFFHKIIRILPKLFCTLTLVTSFNIYALTCPLIKSFEFNSIKNSDLKEKTLPLVDLLNHLNKERINGECYSIEVFEDANNDSFFKIKNSSSLSFLDLERFLGTPAAIKFKVFIGTNLSIDYFFYISDYRDNEGNIVMIKGQWSLDHFGRHHELFSFIDIRNTRYKENLYFSNHSTQASSNFLNFVRQIGVNHITHQTLCSNLFPILESGNLKNGRTLKKANYFYKTIDSFIDKIFVQMEYKNQMDVERRLKKTSVSITKDPLNCILYFSPDVISDELSYYINIGWKHGDVDSRTMYPSSLDPSRLLASDLHDFSGFYENEIVILDELSLLKLVYIAVPASLPDLKNDLETYLAQ